MLPNINSKSTVYHSRNNKEIKWRIIKERKWNFIILLLALLITNWRNRKKRFWHHTQQFMLSWKNGQVKKLDNQKTFIWTINRKLFIHDNIQMLSKHSLIIIRIQFETRNFLTVHIQIRIAALRAHINFLVWEFRTFQNDPLGIWQVAYETQNIAHTIDRWDPRVVLGVETVAWLQQPGVGKSKNMFAIALVAVHVGIT